MKFKTTLLLAFAIACSSVGQGEEREGLVIRGDHKKLPIFVYGDIDSDRTFRDDIVKAVKLRLLANGITTSEFGADSPHWLNVVITHMEAKSGDRVMGQIAYVSIYLEKRTRYYVASPQYVGYYFKPRQGDYSGLTIKNSQNGIMEVVNKYLDDFLLDYLESNIAERERFKKIKAQGSGE